MTINASFVATRASLGDMEEPQTTLLKKLLKLRRDVSNAPSFTYLFAELTARLTITNALAPALRNAKNIRLEDAPLKTLKLMAT